MTRVCVVARDLFGASRDSSTASTRLALVLASRGYDVTILDTMQVQELDNPREAPYRSAGITFEHLDDSIAVSPDYLRESYLLYQHLKPLEFDSIVFPDWLGPAFASVSAKRAGLAFDATQLVIVTHGPTEWVRESNQELKLTHDDLAVGYMERVAIEGADIVVGPSAYLHEWMLGKGWRLGARRAPVPYFSAGGVAVLTGLTDLRPARERPESQGPVRELVFFGRLEHRKGVSLHARALNLVDPELLRGVTLSFLGPEASYTAAGVVHLLSAAVRATADLRFLTTLDREQARAYLHESGGVAVIPSLDANSPMVVYECLEDGVPFVAADVGGIGELVDERDRKRCLFNADPTALAALLTRFLSSEAEVPIARAAFDAPTSLAAWEAVLGTPVCPPVRPTSDPLVSIVVPHHDRPELVALTLESLERQDYPHIEVVLVDDGSASAEAHAALKLFEEREWQHPLRVVRQKNSSPGAARNTGVRQARGDLLLFIDDDDVAQPNYVSAMATAIRNTGSDAVTCAFLMFEDREGPPESPVSTLVFLGGSLPLAAMGNRLGGAGMILRRTAWEAVGGYHEIPGLGLEDWDILVRLLLAGFEVFALPEPLYWYRLRPDGVNLSMDRYESHQIILHRFRQLLPPPLRVFADLVHGQALFADDDPEKRALKEALDLRERYQWLLERQIELLQTENNEP